MTVRKIPKCYGCRNRIDPDYCHCGATEQDHVMGTGHSFIPAGCTCGYEKTIPTYSKSVRERLDPKRPQYSEALKSLAAFVPHEQALQVLITHLDDACRESRMEGVVDGSQLKRPYKRRSGV